MGARAERVVELGAMHVAFSRSTRPRWRQFNNNQLPARANANGRNRARASGAVLHSRINYVYAGSGIPERDYGLGAPPMSGSAAAWPVAYFSAELGLHESLLFYWVAGVLAGDHIKSASDLDIPLIGIGLFDGRDLCSAWTRTGWQREEDCRPTWNQLPMQPAIGVDGEPVVEIRTRGGAIWRQGVAHVKVGRIDLLLLDEHTQLSQVDDRQPKKKR